MLNRFKRFWRTIPPAGPDALREVSQAWMLRMLLLIAIPVVFATLFLVQLAQPDYPDEHLPEILLEGVLVATMIGAYMLNQRGYTQEAVMIITCSFSVALFLAGASDFAGSGGTLLLNLNLVVLFAALFLSIPAVLALLLLDIVGILSLVLLTGTPITFLLNHTIVFVLLANVFILLLMLYRNRIESALQHSEARFRSLVEHQPDILIVLRVPSGRVELTNRDSLMGYEIRTLHINTLLNEAIDPADRERITIYWRGVMGGQFQTPIEVRLRHKDGHWEWLQSYACVLERNDQGVPIRVMMSLRNITEQKRAALQIKQRASIFENAFNAIIITDSRFIITDWNKAAEMIYGWTAHEVIGKVIHEVLHTDFGSDTEETEALQQLIEERHWHGEVVQTHRSGLPIRIESSVTTIHDELDGTSTIVAINRDVTHQRDMESRERHLAVEKERTVLLDRFLRDVAHDFRTPLTAIVTSTYLMKRAPDTTLRHIEAIDKQVQRLQIMIDDLFNLSRLDRADTGEFTFGRVNLNGLLRDVVETHMALLLAKNHTIHTEWHDNLPETLADSNSLYRVFTNLLVNAINYTPSQGTITVRTKQVEDRVIIEFQDTGIGISAENQQQVFERFFRSDEARNVETGGIGLGLAIARKIIEAHGGQIMVESEPGQGSLFRVTLPLLLKH